MKAKPEKKISVRRRKFVAVCLCSPFVALFLFEVFLRAFLPQPPRGFSENLFEVKGGLTFLCQSAGGTQYSREFDVKVRGNRFGYRDGTWKSDLGYDCGTWVIGDSFAFGWGIEAEQTVSAVMNVAGYSCFDFGMPGDGLGEHIKRLKLLSSDKERPERILFFLYDNDFLPQEQDTILASGVPPAFRLRQLLLRLHTVRLAGRVMDWLGASHSVASVTGSDEGESRVWRETLRIHRRGFADEQFSVQAGKLNKLLRQASLLCRDMVVVRIRPVFTSCLESGKVSKYTRRAVGAVGGVPDDYDFTAIDRRVGSICAENNASYMVFGAHDDDEAEAWYFRHDMHLTAAGQLQLANAVIKLIDQKAGANR